MNSQPSPLVPQGQLDPKNKGRARVRLTVFFVLAIHGVGLLALLMQGCRKEEAPPPITDLVDTNAPVAPMMADTNLPPIIDTNTAFPAIDTNPPVEMPQPPTTISTPAVPTTGGSEYKVAKGDTYTTIAKKFGVSAKAIADANPGVDPTRLKIGQPLTIPAPAAPSAGTGTVAPTTSASNGQIYTVRSGDNLIKIAEKHGVTLKALRSANNLTTDRITVGQKLKIPGKASQ